MKIWLVGLYNTYNLGDPLLLTCVRRKLQESFSDCRIRIMNVTGNSGQKPYMIPEGKEIEEKHKKAHLGAMASSQRPWNRIRSLDRIGISAEKALQRELDGGLSKTLEQLEQERPDLVLFGGGEMFLHSFVLPIGKIVAKCKECGIPVIFHACGFGPIVSPMLQDALVETLSDPVVKYISVRDFPAGQNSSGTGHAEMGHADHVPSKCDIAINAKQLAKLEEKRGSELSYAADMGLWADEIYSASHGEKACEAGISSGETISFTGEISTGLTTSFTRGISAEKTTSFTKGNPARETLTFVKAGSASGQGIIGLGVVSSYMVSTSQEVDLFCGLIRELEVRQIPWQLFTNGYPEDEYVARLILQEAGRKGLIRPGSVADVSQERHLYEAEEAANQGEPLCHAQAKEDDDRGKALCHAKAKETIGWVNALCSPHTLTEGRVAEHCLFVPESPAELVSHLCAYSSIISCRLHSHIVAASCGIPSVALAWDEKVPQFFRAVGCPQRCLSFQSTPEEILSALHEAKQKGWDRPKILQLREESRSLLAEHVSKVYMEAK